MRHWVLLKVVWGLLSVLLALYSTDRFRTDSFLCTKVEESRNREVFRKWN